MAITTVTVGGKTFAAREQTIGGVTALVLLDDPGVFGYRSGTAPTTITLPAGALLRKISLVADTAYATIVIGGGDAITVPATMAFDEDIAGVAEGVTVDISGSIVSYYVAWVGG